MSLLVWLPFINNIENQGISNIQFTNTNAVSNTGGKIGNCYYFNGSSFLSATSQDGIKSVCFWIKTTVTASTVAFADQKSKLAFGFTSNKYILLSCNSLSSKEYTNFSAITDNQWVHIAIVKTEDDILLYINGVLQTARGSNNHWTHSTNTLLIGKRSTGSNMTFYMNDFRAYSHCLSPAEIHEIGQGLVLHYKLDDTYMETPTFLTSTINTTAYNSQNGKYGYNADSNLARTEGFFQGKNCIKISTITAGQNAQPYSYFSNLFTSNGTNSPAYKALSFDYFTTCPTTTWLNIYKLGSGTGTATWKTISSTAGIRTGTYTNSSNSILVQPNEWNRVEVIFNGTTDADAQWGYCINGPKHTSSADYYFLFANIQLEQNNHVTGQGEGLHKAIITDSSGYGHNGTILGSPIISSDTARYSFSTGFPANADGILSTYPIALWNNAFTYSFWIKPSGENGGRSIYAASYSGTSCSIEKTAGNKLRFYWNGSPDLSTSFLVITDGIWQHIAIVKEENKTTVKCYYNGVLKDTFTNTFSNKTFSGNLRIARDTRGDATSYTGMMSDFRIYCTALSAADIKQLYEMGGKVDNKQNLYIYEAIEMQPTIKLTKQGQMKAGEFQEDTATKLYETDQIVETNNLIEL